LKKTRSSITRGRQQQHFCTWWRAAVAAVKRVGSVEKHAEVGAVAHQVGVANVVLHQATPHDDLQGVLNRKEKKRKTKAKAKTYGSRRRTNACAKTKSNREKVSNRNVKRKYELTITSSQSREQKVLK